MFEDVTGADVADQALQIGRRFFGRELIAVEVDGKRTENKEGAA